MPDEAELRAKAREAVKQGKLLAEAATRMWGGRCPVLGLRSVTKAEKEFEIQFERDGDNPGLDKFHVHIRCLEVRAEERAEVKARGGQSAQASDHIT